MGKTFKESMPLVSTTKFSVVNGTAIAAGSGAYGSYTTAGSGDFVKGDAMPKGRKLRVIVPVSTLAGTPTALKVALMKGDDANGTNAAEIAATVAEFATPAADTVYEAEIDLAAVDDLTKYYSLGVAVNGASSSVTAIAEAIALVLDPTFI